MEGLSMAEWVSPIKLVYLNEDLYYETSSSFPSNPYEMIDLNMNQKNSYD